MNIIITCGNSWYAYQNPKLLQNILKDINSPTNIETIKAIAMKHSISLDKDAEDMQTVAKFISDISLDFKPKDKIKIKYQMHGENSDE